MNDNTEEAIKIQKQLIPIIKQVVKNETSNCVRHKIMTISSLPNNNKVGVTEAFGSEIKLPYVSTLTFSIGNNVIVEWFHSLNNAIVVRKVE